MLKLTRVGRAILALSLCLGLVASFIWNRNEVEGAQKRLGMGIVSTSWKISELIYEAEKLSQDILLHAFKDLPLADLQMQFDVFWSRIEILDNLEMTRDGELAEALMRLEALLDEMDPILYSDTSPGVETLFRFRDRLDTKMVEFRQAWSRKNNRTSFEELSPLTATMAKQKRKFENISALILGAIICYLFMELALSSLANKREQALRRAASEASDVKSQFIANVSHEIRTPLNGILGTATLLSETKLDPEQTEYVNVLEQAGGLLLSTINDVLDFSKLEAGEVTIHNSDFNLTTLFSAVRGLYEPLAAQKGLALNLAIEGDVVELHGDSRRLRQVLHNLISNAVKFTDSGGVDVTAKFNSMGEATRPPGLMISVRDTGIGIHPEDQKRVFDPFGQSSGDLARSHGGTGLGLTISRDLCEAMGGSLTVQSEVGAGSEFVISLPFRQAETSPEPAKACDDTQSDVAELLKSASILIVDDNRTNRFILMKYLKPLGCELIEAESGAEALAKAGARFFDFILMDVQMPEMDGVTATREILNAHGLQNRKLPCIFGVTANVLPHQVESYLAAGMKDVISKPVSKSQLIAVIQQAAIKLVELPDWTVSDVA